MTMAQFTRTLSDSAPPQVSPALVALWHDARGDLQSAHNVAQDDEWTQIAAMLLSAGENPTTS
jgi:hypothetical protein